MDQQIGSSPSELSISGTTLVGTPEQYLEERIEPEFTPTTAHQDTKQRHQEPAETESEPSAPIPSTPRDIPRGNRPYGLLNRADLEFDNRCSRCGDAFPCLTLSCNGRYEYNVPPTPKKSLEPGMLRHILNNRYRAEWGSITDEEPLRRRREDIRRMAGLRETHDACRELRFWQRRNTPREERQSRSHRLSGATTYDGEEGPASMAFSSSETSKCLHCRTTCSATQDDCPICGGKVQGQCRHPWCNDGTGTLHNPE